MNHWSRRSRLGELLRVLSARGGVEAWKALEGRGQAWQGGRGMARRAEGWLVVTRCGVAVMDRKGTVWLGLER